MSRLMSVSHTEAAVRAGTKTVTRRLGWRFLKAGDRITLCRKVMGRRAGDPLVRIRDVEVVSVRREPLDAITADDMDREGVEPSDYADTHSTFCDTCRRLAWVEWFTRTMGCRWDVEITRIEWRYLGAAKP